jgi:hypothetical protein
MVTIGSSWTPPEDYFKGDDGTYAVTLVRIGVEDREGIFTPGATRSYEGQFGPKTVQDWRFALEDGSVIDAAVPAPRLRAGEEVIHPKSTYYTYLTALAGGKAVAEGTSFDPQKHLVGRMALATIQRDDRGYPRIISLGALPTATPRKAEEVQAAPASAASPGLAQAPLRETVAADAGDALPF